MAKLSDMGFAKTINVKMDNKFTEYKAPKPSFINIPENVNENSYFTGSFSLDPEATYEIWCDKGTISNINLSNGTFLYKAFDIINDEDSTDTLHIKCSKSGYLVSDITDTTINVLFVDMEADEALINNDLTTNAYVTSNLEV